MTRWSVSVGDSSPGKARFWYVCNPGGLSIFSGTEPEHWSFFREGTRVVMSDAGWLWWLEDASFRDLVDQLSRPA